LGLDRFPYSDYHRTLERRWSHRSRKGLRRRILDRDLWTCQVCAVILEPGLRAQVDHIFPLSLGGQSRADNLRACCPPCNAANTPARWLNYWLRDLGLPVELVAEMVLGNLKAQVERNYGR
jgi:hypothetical protein